MKHITAGELKKHCLSILDRIDPEGIIITKHGRPVAKLLPIQSESSELIGALRGKIKVKGNLLSTAVRRDPETSVLRPSRG